MACHIKPPEVLKIPLHVPQNLLMGPGPSNCATKILNASSQQMLGHLDETFLKIMSDVKSGIKYAFQTSNEMTFAVSGTGHCAMETSICNVIENGDRFLVASSGIWGDRALDIGKRIGADGYQMNISAGDVIHVDSFIQVMEEFKPDVVFICHGDSSTGVVQPLNEILKHIERFNCISIVDSVASLGAVPIFMDKWNIDVLYSGSQKILNAPPGLSPISFSSKAVAKIKRRHSPVVSFYMDALLIGNYWRCDDKPIVYHHTAPISLMYALREALAILAEESLEKCWERHKSCAQYLHENLCEMGLELFVPTETYRLPSVTTVKIPHKIHGPAVVQQLRERVQIDIAGGLGMTAGKVWRIGLMGCNCSRENVLKVTEALKSILGTTLKSSL